MNLGVVPLCFIGHVDKPQPRGFFVARHTWPALTQERSSATSVADVFTKLPKGNVRVCVSDSSMGPVVTEVVGLRGGSEWVANEIQQALAHDPMGLPTVRWGETDIPAALRRELVVSISWR